jgi:Na+-driven multidrug efflux pump
LAFGLSHWLQQGPSGVFTAIAIAWSTYAIVCVVIFKRGRWKLKKV